MIKMPIDERDMRMEAAPDIYFITDHYKAWPAVLVRLAQVEARVEGAAGAGVARRSAAQAGCNPRRNSPPARPRTKA